MKKPVAAILLLTLFLNVSGYHFLFLFRKQELKQEMKDYLRTHPGTEHITEFRFSLQDKSSIAQLEWENSHEFWYHGELFDLVEKKTEKDQLLIRCINDTKESNLVKLHEKINKQNQNDASSKSKSAQWLKLIQTAFIATKDPVVFDFHTRAHFFIFKDASAFPAQHDVLTPPPKQT